MIVHGKCTGVLIQAHLHHPDPEQTTVTIDANFPVVLSQGDTIVILVDEMGDLCTGHWCTMRRNGILTDSVAINYFSNFSYPPIVITAPGEYQLRAGLLSSFGTGTSSMLDRELWLSVIPEVVSPGTVRFGVQGLYLQGAFLVNYPSQGMRYDLWSSGSIPVNEPYTSLGFISGGSGGEVLPDVALVDLSPKFVDWIRLELHSDPELTTCIASSNAVLMSTGLLRSATFGLSIPFQAETGEYYLRIVHRNHLPVTFGPISFSGTNTILSLSASDFPILGEDTRIPFGESTRLFRGGNAHLDPGPQHISYTGPNNDRDPILQRIGGEITTATVSGYFNEDVNMDGVVKYTGANNDRDVVLQAIGGSVVTVVVTE